MFSGKIDHNGQALDIKPDPWSIIVLFHNYLNEINIGYETKEVAKGISYFIHQEDEKLEELIEPQYINPLIDREYVKCLPVNFLRGSTFKDNVVIIDEAQNLEYCLLYTSDAADE